MGKKDKAVIPYKLDISISLDALEGVPPDAKAEEITKNWLIKSIILYSNQGQGLLIRHHRQAKLIRDLLDEAVKTSEKSITLEADDYKFLKMCWEESKKPMEANEVIVRIDEKVSNCQKEHDREQNAEDVELKNGEVKETEQK